MTRVLPVWREPPRCLRCRRELVAMTDATGALDGADDEAGALDALNGAFSICDQCGHVAIFVLDRDRLGLRPVRRSEYADAREALHELGLDELADRQFGEAPS